MADIKNTPEQMELPFEIERKSNSSGAQIIPFVGRKESAGTVKSVQETSLKPSEGEILKRVLDRAERLVWYK